MVNAAERTSEVLSDWRNFDSGASFRGAAPAWTFNLTLSGRAKFVIGGKDVVLKRGHCLIRRPETLECWSVPRGCPAGRPHHWHCIYVQFTPRPHWLPWLQFPEEGSDHAVLRLSNARTARRVIRAMKRVFRCAAGKSVFHADLAMNALERVILMCWIDRNAKLAHIDPRVRMAMNYLTESAVAVSLETLARRCHMSRAQFAHLFRKQVGMPPMRFHESQRLERASRLLRTTSAPVRTIAFDLGFDDPHYFSRRFLKYRGVTPRAFRAQYQQFAEISYEIPASK